MDNPREDTALDAYFSRMEPQLRTLTEVERSELRQELRQHLNALVEANIELGRTPEEAVEAAVRQFGDPALIGRKVSNEVCRPRSYWLPAALIVGMYGIAWGFADMLKTGGDWLSALRQVPWGAAVGLVVWYSMRNIRSRCSWGRRRRG